MDRGDNRFIRGLYNVKPDRAGSVATIGSFDGVHLGHTAILSRLREKSAEYRLPSVAVIFEPHPKEFFSGEQAPARLLRTREKVETLFEQGIDQVCCIRFDQQFRSLTAQQFISRVLTDGLGVKFLMVGDDFRFGCSREGDYDILRAAGKKHGFEVANTVTVEHLGKRVSSTWIREALHRGDFDLAATLLGRPYLITGKVAYGQQLGKQLGFPTANIRLNRYRAPLEGVFVVRMTIVDNEEKIEVEGVANVGVRPTLGDLVKPVLEVHVLDFNRDIYGKRVQVEFVEKIREEQKFSSLDNLKAAIEQDVKTARQFFSSQEPFRDATSPHSKRAYD